MRPGIVGMGSMSDPYSPFEGELQLTRHALGLLDAYGFRGGHRHQRGQDYQDIDVLCCMREHVPVLCKGDRHHHRCRPGRPGGAERPQPARRMEAVARLAEAGCLLACCSCRFSPFFGGQCGKRAGGGGGRGGRQGPGLSTPRSV